MFWIQKNIRKKYFDNFSREDYNRLVRYLFFKGTILNQKHVSNT